MRTALDYLIFDYSEDEDGCATWDAMATVRAERLPALQKEVLEVLSWADKQFPRQRGALDEGASWDYELSARTPDHADIRIEADLAVPTLRHAPLDAAQLLTLTLTLTGRSAFADAFVCAFEVE